MGRTAVNVLGNCLACVVIARWEHEYPAAADSSAEAPA
jgi:Na+/H+-dicarboxylate symporter